jgi:hypothetical protein
MSCKAGQYDYQKFNVINTLFKANSHNVVLAGAEHVANKEVISGWGRFFYFFVKEIRRAIE